MRRFASAVLLSFAALAAAPALASIHVGAGPVDEIEGEGSWHASVAWLTEQTHPWEFIVGYIDGRDAPALSTPDVYWVSASKRFTWRGWFAQSGVAWTDSDTEVLSKHFQFQTGIGYDFGRVSISLRHLSNANTGGRNRGENLLLLDYAF
jgi:hypothetical protein